MIVSSIVAVAKNRVIGHNNDIPWYLPADLKYFKKQTLNRHIIMGRNCYNSIGKPLPKRTNIILTRNPYFIVSNCLVTHSIPEALQLAHENGEEEVFIIGGAQIYQHSMPLWDRLYYTEVDIEPKGDILFPELDWSEWNLESEESHKADEKNEHDYIFKIFNRVSK